MKITILKVRGIGVFAGEVELPFVVLGDESQCPCSPRGAYPLREGHSCPCWPLVEKETREECSGCIETTTCVGARDPSLFCVRRGQGQTEAPALTPAPSRRCSR